MWPLSLTYRALTAMLLLLLLVLCSVCVRGRYDTDEVRKPLQYTLLKLQDPLLNVYKTLLGLVPTNEKNKDALEQVLKGKALWLRRIASWLCTHHVCPAPCSTAHCVPHLLLPELDDHPRALRGQPRGVDARIPDDAEVHQPPARRS